jgi:ABC-type branched-subunit amino acid transport system ATPase component
MKTKCTGRLWSTIAFMLLPAVSWEADQMLAITALTNRFGGSTVLSSVSFEVKVGEILGLIGVNGSGKTTLSSCRSASIRASIIFCGVKHVSE